MTKKALGKGLKAFLPEEYGILKEERFLELDIDQLKPNPKQPRKRHNPESLDELAQSIRETGVLQPVVAVQEEGAYKIIVGERRWRAAKKAGLQKIPVIIRTLNVEQQHEASLVENLQRDDLNPLEIALAYQRMIQEFGCTQQNVAEKVGKDRTSVANYLRLLKLPQEIQDFIAEGKLTMGHARALLSIDNPRLQKSMAQNIIAKNISVREVEKWVRKFQNSAEEPQRQPMNPDLLVLQEELLKLLSTKVAISGDQNKGVLKIYYYTLDDLNRIYEQIKGGTL
ncbi:MAG: ParB/RepB/Spo0J family partition protein [Candidatus Aminicenantes bacterium]|nr:ParB/RepB/Spo0J family partition protein [Candidatus Aminicenantes bacterium]